MTGQPSSDTSDLVDVVLDHLGVVELFVPVDRTVPKQLVMVVELVVKSLHH